MSKLQKSNVKLDEFSETAGDSGGSYNLTKLFRSLDGWVTPCSSFRCALCSCCARRHRPPSLRVTIWCTSEHRDISHGAPKKTDHFGSRARDAFVAFLGNLASHFDPPRSAATLGGCSSFLGSVLIVGVCYGARNVLSCTTDI